LIFEPNAVSLTVDSWEYKYWLSDSVSGILIRSLFGP